MSDLDKELSNLNRAFRDRRIEVATRAALEAWDALHHTARAITGPDFLEAMERLRMEVYG